MYHVGRQVYLVTLPLIPGICPHRFQGRGDGGGGSKVISSGLDNCSALRFVISVK